MSDLIPKPKPHDLEIDLDSWWRYYTTCSDQKDIKTQRIKALLRRLNAVEAEAPPAAGDGKRDQAHVLAKECIDFQRAVVKEHGYLGRWPRAEEWRMVEKIASAIRRAVAYSVRVERDKETP